MTSATPQALVRRLVDEFERRGWKDDEQAALAAVRAIMDADGEIDPKSLASVPSRTFLARNHTTRAEVEAAFSDSLSGQTLLRSLPALIPIDDIDTFSAAATVAPQDVASIAAPGLPLLEETVKRYVARIIGEPYLDKDWGGELSDIRTSRVQLGGKRVHAAFLLKGRAKTGKLRPKDLGANGDQIRRLSKQEVELFIVQFVGQIDDAVYDELRDMVLARRAEGNNRAVGSIWDGADCARLFIAHGLIDPATGTPLI